MNRFYALFLMLLFMGSASAQVLVNETFENGNTVDQVPVGWICNDNGWKAGITIPDDNTARGRKPHTGDWYMYAKYNTDVWIYKEIEATAGSYYRVSFWYATWHVDHFDLEVKAGASAEPSAMTVSVVPQMVVDNEDYAQTSAVFQAPSSGAFYVGFHSVADNGPWYLSIDDVVIEQTEQYNFEIEQLTPDTAVYFGEPAWLRFRIHNTGDESDTYHFNNTGSLVPEFYQNGALVDNVTIPYNSSVDFVANVVLPDDLSDEEELHATFEVVPEHADTQVADFKITAMTPHNVFPMTEGFENDFPPFGWQNIITSGNYAFDRITEGSTPNATPHEGSQYMARFYTYTNAAGNSAELVSPKLALNPTNNVVSFWVFRNSNPNINREDRFNVYFNTEPTSEGGELLGTVHRCTYMDPVVADVDDWYEYSYTFDCPTGNGFVIFEGVSDYGWNLYLDDITLNVTDVDEEAPTLISLTGTQEYADTEMYLKLRAYDASAMPETLEAEVTIGDDIMNYEFVLDRSDRANYDYMLTLPAQTNHTSGYLSVNLVDEHGNSAEVGPVELHWDYQRPLLYETFEECDILSIPEGWSTDGNPTWWDWSVLGAMHYTDYYGSEYEVAPHGGQRHAVLEWDSSDEPSAQDQTLVTPVLSITRPTVLEFWTWVQYGLDGFDHFAVRVYDTYNGTWEDKWDAADQPSGQVNAYSAPISINLDEYIGRNIKIGFRGYNTFGEFLAFDWFVDDVKVIVTDTVEVPPTGLGELSDVAVSLYPNPVKDRLHIDSDRTIRQLQVMDVNGVMIENKKVNVNTIDLDLVGYSKGCYFLRLVTDEGVVVKPIVLSE